ncbi:MAG: thiamine phosphate synthase [Pseudomonadota bacterium]
MLKGLYVLTDDRIYPPSQWPSRVESIIEGGANVIQLREKNLSDDELRPYALKLQEICTAHEIPLIINDRVELAKNIQADGVHIGSTDSSLKATRDYLGHDVYIGVSCYRDIYRAIRAQHLGADYIAFGRLFSSLTKKDANYCPISIIQKAKKHIYIPICGIGGITADNAKKVSKAGASLIATADSVFNANNPEAVAKRFTV